MAYCGPRGIPYETFLAWPDLSRTAAIAWARRDAERCGRCHQHRSDWVDESGVQLHPPPFELIEVLCPGCQQLDHRSGKDAMPLARGHHLAFRPVEDWKPASPRRWRRRG